VEAMAFNATWGRLAPENALEGAFYTLLGAFFATRRMIPAFAPKKDSVDKYASKWLFIAHFDAE
jgi:hypothetical protein